MKANAVKKKTVAWALLLIFLFSVTPLLSAARGGRQGYLGVSVERLTREEREELKVTHGVIVTNVVGKSPAEKAGILEDDVILYFAGEKIRKTDDLVEAVRDTEPKTSAKVTLNRDGKRMDIDVTVGKLRSAYMFSYGGDGNVITVMRGGGGYLGVQLHELNADLAEYFGVEEDGGALVLSVEEESPAAEGGLKSGDVIVEVDEEEIWDPQDVRDILSDFEEGDEVEIFVVRHKRKQKLTVELDERAGGGLMNNFFRSRDLYNRAFKMNIRSPRHYRMDVPHLYYHFDNDAEDRLREKLEVIPKKLEKNLKGIEEKMKRVRAFYFI